MLRETSQFKFENAAEVSTAFATSQIETAVYIEALTSELQQMAKRSGMVLLTYLLSMVVLSARERIEQGKDSRPPASQ